MSYRSRLLLPAWRATAGTPCHCAWRSAYASGRSVTTSAIHRPTTRCSSSAWTCPPTSELRTATRVSGELLGFDSEALPSSAPLLRHLGALHSCSPPGRSRQCARSVVLPLSGGGRPLAALLDRDLEHSGDPLHRRVQLEPSC